MRGRPLAFAAYIRRHHVGLVALFFALSGGVAWATHPGGANTINSADIIDGEVKEADVGQGAVASHELKNDSILPGDVAPNSLTSGRIGDGQVKVPDIATGAVRTDELANGQVQAEDLAPGVAPGASGARAWGVVSEDGALIRSKNVTSATHPSDGVYCIDPGPGIDPSAAVLVAAEDLSANFTDDFSETVSHAEWDSSGAGCPAGTMTVATFVGFGSAPSFDDTDFGGFDLEEFNQPFTFVIP